MKVQFTVPGPPVAKGRPRFGKHGTYTPPKTAAYEQLVRACYLAQCGGQKLTGALQVSLLALFPIPKSAPKKARAEMLSGGKLPDKKPDLDNIAKAVLDALNGVAYGDDAQVTDLLARKRYGDPPGVTAVIREKQKT